MLVCWSDMTRGSDPDWPLSCMFPSGETGLLVGKVTKRSPFVGYAGNQQQTEKKRLRDVLRKGDLYFNTGDLLRVDHENFVYFQDRVGDTFRWVFSFFFFFYSRLWSCLTLTLIPVVVFVTDGKARTLPRQRLETFSRWLAVFWKQTSTVSRSKVKHSSKSQKKPAALLRSVFVLTHF